MCDCTSSFSPYSCIRFSPSSIRSISFLGSFHWATNKPTKFSLKISQNSYPSSSSSRSEEHEFPGELKFKEREPTKPEFELSGNGDEETDFLQVDGNLRENEAEEEDMVKITESEDDVDLKLEELDVNNNNQSKVIRKGKQLMKRSNVIAKQVISIQSALSLGFISQLWVDTNTWMVVIVEVRPNLLSGELERFFLEDTRQVGDVVLIQDETVMDNEFKMVGLETLVGYSVVTPGQRDIGKVRGYTFNINSGVIESLELDSFGISIIPSSLVSTYELLVEDVLEVVSDTVVVHEAAASRIQRLTKGFWDGQRVGYSIDNYSGLEGQSGYRKGRRRSGVSSQKPRKRPVDDTEEEWDLPMDYL
ncbi:uncharacterized protein LOC112518431 [Cynara cardunculus var. scolymus]|uniref:uncharacterized protein LOC112518431 n=1 Tax=Cynara cardunculus var. scolymus TaxID=59895 RepID=UPI000D625589|nr:uncharacterized protein LOC112518431 [Cynara cardunculus var. scolymus]